MRIIELTESLCSTCLKKLDAEIVEENGQIYISKTCPEHGPEKALIWSDASTYRTWEENSAYAPKYKGGSPVEKSCPYDCGYCEDHRGTTCTAVIEVTDRCNMGCAVCFAAADAVSGYDKNPEKIKEMIRYVAETHGFCSLQLSGGEPTLRDDLPGIISYAKGLGFRHIQVNSNGIRLAAEYDFVCSLKEAGCDLIYLGFDGISDDIYQSLRNRNMLDVKKGCIENCRRAGLGVMLVPVIIKGLNNHQVGPIVDFAKKNMPTVKGIHFQPASQFGRYELSEGAEDADARYTFPDLFADLKEQTNKEVCPCGLNPRKKKSAYCSFSGTYYLDFDGRLQSLSKQEENPVPAVSSSAGGCCSTDSSSGRGISAKIVPAQMHLFARKTNDFTEKFWKQNGAPSKGEAYSVKTASTEKQKQSALARFSRRVESHSLSISGMPFQDAGNIDINRVRNCCVSVIDESLKAIPLCLYYLTDRKGNRLYREGKCTVC